jgi:hypothetical protein
MYRKANAEAIPLTPELASYVATLTPVPGERCLRPARRMYLTTQLLHGKFCGPDWAVGVCKEDGLTYRLDGQHSSDLLANLPSGTPFPTGLLVTLTTYEFDSMADAADVFNLFDNPRSVRNNADMMGIYAAHVPELKGYTRDFLIEVSNGLHEAEMQRKRRGAKDAVLFGPRDRGLYFAVPDRPDFVAIVHWLADFRERKNGSFLSRSVIVSDMIANRAMAPELAKEFWTLVFSENHPDPDHETRILAETFREMLAVAAKQKLDLNVFRRKSQRAWKQFKASSAQQAA